MIFGLGLIIAVMSMLGSVFHMHQSILSYIDLVGFLVVVGGTAAVGVITLPWEHFEEIKRGLRYLVAGRPRNQKELVLQALQAVQDLRERRPPQVGAPGLPGEILRDGAELIQLGIGVEKTRAILTERIYQGSERAQRVANALRTLSKYPPAFGLVGTVLGLVSLMRAISDGAGSQETGLRMAVALVSTLYGLLVSNLILNPAGEHILRASLEDKRDAELALQAILLAAEPATTMLETQEMLNSFVDRKHWVDLSAGRSAA